MYVSVLFAHVCVCECVCSCVCVCWDVCSCVCSCPCVDLKTVKRKQITFCKLQTYWQIPPPHPSPPPLPPCHKHWLAIRTTDRFDNCVDVHIALITNSYETTWCDRFKDLKSTQFYCCYTLHEYTLDSSIHTFSLSKFLNASMASFLFLKWYSFLGGGASSSLSELDKKSWNKFCQRYILNVKIIPPHPQIKVIK